MAEAAGLLEAEPGDLERRPRVTVGERTAEVRPGPDLRGEQPVLLGQARPASRQPTPS